MAVLYANVSENAERVIDPVASQVIESLVRKLGVYEFFKDNTHVQNDRSASSLFNTPDGQLNLTASNRLDVVVDTHFNPDEGQMFDGLSTGVNTPALWMGNHSKANRREIFSDREIGFSVRELNMPFTLSFEITMRFREYDGACLALSNILNRSKKELVNEVHDIVYSYPFDYTSWAVLSQVFKRRLAFREANPDAKIVDYLDTISKAQWGFDIRRPDLTETATAKGDTEYAVTRQQLSCSAKLDCSIGKPEPIMSELVPIGYNITCQYSIQFGRPHLLEFEIPPVIEQSPMPNVFFNTACETDDPKVYGVPSDPTTTQMMWYASNGKYSRSAHIKMPEYDDWYVPFNALPRERGFIPVIATIALLDEVGKPTEVDLTAFEDIKLAPFVLEILGTMSKEDLTTYSGLFNIAVYANDYQLDNKFLNWNPETKIFSFTGNKREVVYRIVFSEASELNGIDVKWKDTLIKYRQFVPAALMRTMGYLSQVGILWVIGDKAFTGFISRCMLSGKLRILVNEMLKRGCNKNITKYTNDVSGFVKFVCNTLYKDQRYTVFDLLLEVATDLKILTVNETFGRQLHIGDTYNYDYSVGGLPNGHNEPFRVFKASGPAIE